MSKIAKPLGKGLLQKLTQKSQQKVTQHFKTTTKEAKMKECARNGEMHNKRTRKKESENIRNH